MRKNGVCFRSFLQYLCLFQYRFRFYANTSHFRCHVKVPTSPWLFTTDKVKSAAPWLLVTGKHLQHLTLEARHLQQIFCLTLFLMLQITEFFYGPGFMEQCIIFFHLHITFCLLVRNIPLSTIFWSIHKLCYSASSNSDTKIEKTKLPVTTMHNANIVLLIRVLFNEILMKCIKNSFCLSNKVSEWYCWKALFYR